MSFFVCVFFDRCYVTLLDVIKLIDWLVNQKSFTHSFTIAQCQPVSQSINRSKEKIKTTTTTTTLNNQNLDIWFDWLKPKEKEAKKRQRKVHHYQHNWFEIKLPSFDYCNPEADLLELRQLEAGERYARSHGPFGCTPRPSSEVSRTSLLGRPIKPGPHRHHDPRYRKSQSFVYNFLERPRGWKAFIYHFCM